APRLGELATLDVRVVLVGNGPPEAVAAFHERNALADKPVEVVTDPTLAVYRAAGLQRSAQATHRPLALLDFVRALSRRHRPQGGTLPIGREGAVIWSHRNASMGDHADPSDAIDAVLALRLRRAPLPV